MSSLIMNSLIIDFIIEDNTRMIEENNQIVLEPEPQITANVQLPFPFVHPLVLAGAASVLPNLIELPTTTISIKKKRSRPKCKECDNPECNGGYENSQCSSKSKQQQSCSNCRMTNHIKSVCPNV